MSGWLYLIAGIFGEIAWVLSLRMTEGYSKVIPSCINLVIALFNIYVLSKAFELLPTATGYAIWVGISAVGVSVGAVYLYGEKLNLTNVGFIALIIIGVIGLKFSTTH
jgi:quaternary ammonium compound-resistance protein SugE